MEQALRNNDITQYKDKEINTNRSNYLLSFKLRDAKHLQNLLNVFTKTRALRYYEFKGDYYLLALWLYVKDENNQYILKPENAIKFFSDFYIKIVAANGFPKVLLNPAVRPMPCPGNNGLHGCGKYMGFTVFVTIMVKTQSLTHESLCLSYH